MNKPKPSILSRLKESIIRFFGGRYEWEVQTTEPDGCWRLWSDGFASLADAMEHANECVENRDRWNQYMEDKDVKWRVERRIIWSKYYY